MVVVSILLIKILLIIKSFILDGKGIVRQITMNDLPVGRSVDETIRLVQAFQYADVILKLIINYKHKLISKI